MRSVQSGSVVLGIPRNGDFDYVALQQDRGTEPRMFESVFPVLPLLIACHAWMTIMLVQTLDSEDVAVLAPECFPV
jgi:hypothetical protein